MRELQLVGYTADLHHLVFTDADEGGGRFKAAIDEDFIATLDEVFKLTDPDGAPRVPLGAIPASDRPRSDRPAADQEPSAADGNGEIPAGGMPGSGPLAGMAAAALGREASEQPEPRGTPEPAAAQPDASSASDDRSRPSRVSKLAPREIQSLLRAGMGPRAVAKQAETDEQWVRRWLTPIERERDQVLRVVQSRYVEKARLGRSADPLGEAVHKNLTAKGLDPDDPAVVQWMAARREHDAYWKVTLRYRSRGRAQRALWRFDPDTGELDPRNALAVDIAWTRGGKGKSAKAARGKDDGDATAGKKAAGKKTGGKKAAGKKTAGKKTAGKKTAGKKTAGKKTAGKKTAGKKTAGKKTAGKKAAGKKAAGKKTVGKKTTAKKVEVRKATGGTTAAKRSDSTQASP